MTKELTQLQIDAARMVATGVFDSEIGETLGRSRRWVQEQKRLPEFVALVEEFTENYKQSAIQQNNLKMQEELKISRERARETCNKLFKLCDILVERLTTRLNNLEPEDLKASQLPQALKILTDSYQSVTNIESEYFGLNRLIVELEKVRKLAGTLD